MTNITISWSGIDTVTRNMGNYGDAVAGVAEEIVQHFAPLVEEYAKTNARWVDRTGNARQSLQGLYEIAEDAATLYITHRMEYGVWLETRYAGRYAILWEAIQVHLPEITNMLRRRLG